MEKHGSNLATLSPAERDAINAHKQECLERYRQAVELANSIYSQLKTKGRMWAERELAARPELQAEARAKLNRMRRGQASE
ncbi:hypothetical protein ACFSKY_22600 [Azotobacter chroococcum]|uniref:Uncharacterized protein n=1 Tax=Azotobacter chroococcum TaxID=353 RepID=A0A4R1P6A3_9GAMM|nr:hypothetical protein [Azotobacter chroococcum]TBV95295.1 hypothetical protein E0E53_13065 [Azotobacter chroococcum]TCL22075.1 hypothetical protein EV691_13524 [Azotobacter chroococcum]